MPFFLSKVYTAHLQRTPHPAQTAQRKNRLPPFGSLFLGGLAGWIGAAGAVLVGGSACCVAAVLFALQLPRLRQAARPVYVRLGILPEVASGLQAAAELERPPEA